MTSPRRASMKSAKSAKSVKYSYLVKVVGGTLAILVLFGGLLLGCFGPPGPTSPPTPKFPSCTPTRQPFEEDGFFFYVSGRDNPEKGTMSLDWVVEGLQPECLGDVLSKVKFYLHYGKEAGVYTTKVESGVRVNSGREKCDGDFWCNPDDSYAFYKGGGTIENLDKPDSEATHYFKGVVEYPDGNRSASFSFPELSMTATPAPKIISALPGNERIKLDWTPTKDAVEYVVTYRQMRDDDSATSIRIGGSDIVHTGVKFVDKNRTFLRITAADGLKNAVEGKLSDYYVFTVAAVMSKKGLTGYPGLHRAALRTVGGKGGVARVLAKPELKLQSAISIKRQITTGGVSQEVEEVFLKEGDILKGIPGGFASAFRPQERGSICEGTEEGCEAKIEVSYSDDKLIKIIDGHGGVKPAAGQGSLFGGVGNEITASYSVRNGINGLLLRFPVNQRAIEGTATITAKLTYGLETTTSQTVFSLSGPE